MRTNRIERREHERRKGQDRRNSVDRRKNKRGEDNLLKIFNLQERYIDEHTPLENFEVNADIDWNSVNALLQKHKKKSKQFLLNVLEK